MRKLLRRQPPPTVSLERQTPRPTPGLREANQALYRAECDRELGESRTQEVEEAAQRLREVRGQNHFAEMIRLSMGGHA